MCQLEKIENLIDLSNFKSSKEKKEGFSYISKAYMADVTSLDILYGCVLCSGKLM